MFTSVVAQTAVACRPGAEAWAAFGDWVESCKPELGPGIKQRVEDASKVTPEQVRQTLLRGGPAFWLARTPHASLADANANRVVS